MLGLPPTTEVKRPLPKAQLFKRFDWTPSQRERFDSEVSRLDFVNWISPRTVPAIAVGNEVKEIFVVEVVLKRRCFDAKSIELLAKAIPQCIVFLLSYGDEAMLAVYHTKLFTTGWHLIPNVSDLISLNGLNLDAVWVNIVNSVRSEQSEVNSPLLTPNYSLLTHLTEQIKIDEERAKLERQIAALERQMNATKQPRRKRELFVELQKLKNYVH